MQTIKNGVPETEAQVLGARIREARDNVGFSRASLSEKTGIPTKSIERIEAGSMEPSIFRLRDLSEVLGVPVSALVDVGTSVNDDGSPPQAPPPAPMNGEDPDAEEEIMDPVEVLLDRLDELREKNFENAQREALATIETLAGRLKFLEPDALVELARKRGVFLDDCPNPESILDALLSDVFDGQELCGRVEEKIIDTAVFGIDLFAIDLDALSDLADRLETDHELDRGRSSFTMFSIEEETFAGLVPALRPVLRSLAVMGDGVDFSDSEAFPRR